MASRWAINSNTRSKNYAAWLFFAGLTLSALVSVPTAQAQADLGPEKLLSQWLSQKGLLEKSLSARHLNTMLRRGEIAYLDGGSQSAAALLGALLLDPSVGRFANTPVYDNICYNLAAALHRQGAFGRSRQILMDLVSEKHNSVFHAPAFRKLIDLTLDSGQYEQSLKALASLTTSQEEKDELAYLKGRAMIELGFEKLAPQAFAQVSRHSRFRAAALYYLGLLALEKKDTDQATSHFCSIVHQPGGGKFTFLVSQHSPAVIAQAWLALARIRHDAGQYQRAIDTYAMVPAQSAAYTNARYESAWSLYRLARHARSTKNLQKLLEQNPSHQDWPSARLLLGYTHISQCQYDEAHAEFEFLARSLAGNLSARENPSTENTNSGPLAQALGLAVPLQAKERKAQSLSQAITESRHRTQQLGLMLARVSAAGQTLPAKRQALTQTAADLQADLSRAAGLEQRMAEMEALLRQQNEPEQMRIFQSYRDQIRQARARATKAEGILSSLPLHTELGGQISAKKYLNAEQAELHSLQSTLLGLQQTADSLHEAGKRNRQGRAMDKIAEWARLTAIGFIDATLARKQASETEIQNLAQGRYPMELFRELAEAGLIDENLEYWPYDGEDWPDEVQKH